MKMSPLLQIMQIASERETIRVPACRPTAAEQRNTLRNLRAQERALQERIERLIGQMDPWDLPAEELNKDEVL